MASLRAFLTPSILLFLVLTILLVWVEVVITHTNTFSQHPVALSAGVVFDLVFVTSFLFYRLVAQPLRLATSRTILMAILMLRLASFVLPKAAFLPNGFWPYLLAITEATALILAGLRIRTIARSYKRLRPQMDAESALHGSLTPIFGNKAANIIIGEGLTLYYVLLGWRLKSDVSLGSMALTTHRQSGQTALVVGLLIVGGIEAAGIHLLLNRWNTSVAFWVTLSTVYGMLFLVADAIATVKRPSYLTDTHLHLRLGVRWRALIPRSAIVAVAPIYQKPVKQSGQLNGAFLTAPNVLLTFNEPVCVLGPYGLQKQINQLSFFVDYRDSFVYQLGQ